MNYFDAVRKHHPDATDLTIEMTLARTPRIEQRTGLTQLQHRLNALKLMFPDRLHLDWYTRKVASVYRCRAEQRKELGWWGSSNSLKTSTLADIALFLWWEDPDYTSIYIASPFKHATETNLWARIVDQFNTAKGLHRELPGRLVTSQSKIMQYERNPLSFIQVATVDDIGKLVGKKARVWNQGMLVIIIDEAPNLPNNGVEMLGVLGNLRSVSNFLVIYAGNFADTGDFMGRISEPVGGYEAIKGQEGNLQEFVTKRKGLVLHFDGHDSENYRLGRDEYPFVTTIDYLSDLAETEGGTASPGYMRFGRSWPVLDISEYRVTTSSRIESSRARERAHFNADTLVRVSFCDPGFGGDACVIQDLAVGNEIYDGRVRQVVDIDGAPIVVPIDLNKTDSAGRKLTPEQQIVLFHKEHCEATGIPPSHAAFDGSMRSGIVHAYASYWSLEVVPMDSQGEATERMFDAKNSKRWKDEVFNLASELWFACGLLIQSGQLRSLSLSPRAEEQLCARPWLWKGSRKQILPKEKWKKENRSRSPNEADALCGAVEMARRFGLRVLALSGSGLNAIALYQKVREEKAALAEVKRILGGNTLPKGQLRGIQANGFRARSRLHH